jgi:hypothetical protein
MKNYFSKLNIKDIALLVFATLAIFFFITNVFTSNSNRKQIKQLRQENKSIEAERKKLFIENVKLKTEADALIQSINDYQKDIDSINVLLTKNKIELQNALGRLKKGKEQLERTRKEIEKLENNPIKRTGNELLNSIKEKTK